MDYWHHKAPPDQVWLGAWSSRQGQGLAGTPQVQTLFDVGHFGIDDCQGIAVTIACRTTIAQNGMIAVAGAHPIDDNPVAIGCIVGRIGGNECASQRTGDYIAGLSLSVDFMS